MPLGNPGAGLFQVVLTDFFISKVVALGTAWTYLLVARASMKPHKVRVTVGVGIGIEVDVGLRLRLGVWGQSYAGVGLTIEHTNGNALLPRPSSCTRFQPWPHPKPAEVYPRSSSYSSPKPQTLSPTQIGDRRGHQDRVLALLPRPNPGGPTMGARLHPRHLLLHPHVPHPTHNHNSYICPTIDPNLYHHSKPSPTSHPDPGEITLAPPTRSLFHLLLRPQL